MALRTPAAKRRRNLRGCFNFRDAGGYPTTAGRQVRRGRLFRSDGLHALTAADQREVADLGIAAVLDFRTREEVAEQGLARVATALHQLPMPEVLPSPPGTPGCQVEAEAVAETYYAILATSSGTIRQVMAVLADATSYPAVVCCSSGVDRTGVVTAVVLSLLGVPDHLVIGDYAASREATLRRMGRLRFEYPSSVSRDLDRYGTGLLGVVPEAMALFLDRVRTEHGSFARYAELIDMAGAVVYLRSALLE